MPSVSVIVTCYNLERFIGEALESLLGQTYSGPVEIVVVDDCSTDGSADVIRSFPQVTYVRNAENSGVLLSTVAGIRASEGELVLFLDGDDIWEPGKLDRAVDRFRASDRLALLTHDLSYIDEGGRAIARESRPSQVFAGTGSERHDEMVRQGILLLSDYVWLGSAFGVHRQRAQLDAFCDWANGLPEPRSTYQDWPLAYWVASLPQAELGYVPEKLFRYRLHGTNHSGDASDVAKAIRNIKRTLNTLRAMRDLAVERGLDPATRAVAESEVGFYHYLVHLYSGRRLRAAAGFIGSLGYLMRHPKLAPKELTRFAGLAVLGPERFTRLVKRPRKTN